MKRRLAGLWLLLLAVLAGVAMCGAERVGYKGGYAEEYGARARGGYSGGGGSAAWDTFETAFVMADSLGWPTPPAAADSFTTTRDPYYIVARDTVIARARRSGGVYELGTGKDLSTFAWTTIKQSDTDGYYSGLYYYMRSDIIDTVYIKETPGGAVTSQGVLRTHIGNLAGTRTIPMFYIPFESAIPAHATIVSATLHVRPYNAFYHQKSDTVIAVALDNANDNDWYTVKGGTGVTNTPNYAKASWLYQNDTNAGAWGGSQLNAWSPSLADRKHYWSLGSVSDWNGTFVTDYYRAGANVSIDITDCVQNAVAGGVNNGIALLWQGAGTSTSEPLFFGWDAYSGAVGRQPYVTVKYITKRYQKPYGSSDWAFSFSTDDFIEKSNSAFVSVFKEHKVRYTLYGSRIHVDNPRGKQCGMDSLLAWHSLGFEIAPHGYSHQALGLPYFERQRPGTAWDDTARAQVYADAKPDWLYALADSATGNSLESDPLFGKTFALPNAFYSAGSLRVLMDLDYVAIRAAQAATISGGSYFTAPSWAPAYGDTFFAAPQTWNRRRALNMRAMPLTVNVRAITGDTIDSSASLDSIKINTRRLIAQLRGTDRREWIFFEHDFKSGANKSGFGYTDGCDTDELDAIMDVVVDEMHGRVMTCADLARWKMSRALPTDTPAGFYNAPVSDDSSKYYADEGVWFIPNGIDNRWIGTAPPAYAAAAGNDSRKPSAPATFSAIAGDNIVIASWGVVTDADSYNLYRFYEGGSDTTKISLPNVNFYADTQIANGSPHGYFVTAVDAAGNESADSAHAVVTPKAVRNYVKPPLYTLWLQDPADVALRTGERDTLAMFDLVSLGPHIQRYQAEAKFDSLLNNVRAVNPLTMMLSYARDISIDWDSKDWPTYSPYRRIFDYCASLPDSGGFAHDTAAGVGNVVRTDPASGYGFIMLNVMSAGLADTIARYYVDGYEDTGINKQWAGFFVDDVDTMVSAWMCNSGDCGGLISYDGDATAFDDDADETHQVKAFHDKFIMALRREMAQRGYDNRLIVANTTFARKPEADLTYYDSHVLGLLDGVFVEAPNINWPGNNAADAEAAWTTTFAAGDLLVNSQVSPPLEMVHVKVDSSSQYMSEILAVASNGWACAQTDGSYRYGIDAVPTPHARLPFSVTGTPTVTFQEAGSGLPDTMTVTTPQMTGRMIMGQAYADTFAVWPYIVISAAGDTVSRSLYWETAGEIGAPGRPLVVTAPNKDRYVPVTMGFQANLRPRDFSHFALYRGVAPHNASPHSIDLFKYIDPDTLDLFYDGTTSWVYNDYAVVNDDSCYSYKLASIDVLGNVSTMLPPDGCRTPSDIVLPPAVESLTAAGATGYVDVDWTYPNQPEDFATFRVWRKTATTAYTKIDSVATSYYQDDAAISGVEYTYKIIPVDDDGKVPNHAAPTTMAAWYGTVEPTYPAPSQVRAIANYTPFTTAVVIYPPTDQTGLTSYTVYRGRWNGVAAPDTSLCVKRITGLTPDGFGGAVYLDAQNATVDPDSAFQYTACAIYSGNRSAKYAMPATAYSDGGFAAQVPACHASGGSSIFVWWESVAGADQTQIQRSTNGTTWSDLTTEGSGVYTYADVSAVCGTDYYYRCRQYDTETATWTAYSTATGAFRWACYVAGDPAITGVTGTVRNGLSVTVAGNNFGSKAIPAPRAWDTFESGGNNGDVLSLAAGWTKISEDVNVITQHSSSPRYTTAKAHAGSKSLLCSFANPTDHSSFWVQDTARLSQQFYIDAWMWYDHGPVYTRSWKPWDMYDNTGNSSVVVDWHGDCNGTTIQVSAYTGGAAIPGQVWSDVNSEVNADIVDFEGGWHHVQIYFRTSIPAGTRTGVAWIALDGAVVTNRTDMLLLASDATRTWGELGLGYYNTRDQQGCSGTVGNAYMWWDNVYVDSSRARVEIGTSTSHPSNPTYAQCDNREIQIPSAWAANGTSITATVNTGSFANGTAYLFVVNSDGTASPGYAITIANP